MPNRVMLVGAPGTGKTLLARAIAGEAEVPFFRPLGVRIHRDDRRRGAARVRDLFRQAREAGPSIIFIDQLDAIGRSRGSGAALGGHDEREQTLNQILTEMDGFDPREGIVVVAATNRPDVLDAALLRPGAGGTASGRPALRDRLRGVEPPGARELRPASAFRAGRAARAHHP